MTMRMGTTARRRLAVSSLPLSILLLLSAVVPGSWAHEQHSDHQHDNGVSTSSSTSVLQQQLQQLGSRPVTSHCHLQCLRSSNTGSSCQQVDDTHAGRIKRMQNGRMLDTCGECLNGFGGLACDIPAPQCDDDGRCPDGSLCQRGSNNGEPSCDPCLYADAMSMLTGQLCRNPITEYCTDDGALFCTHGGKCKSNLVAYQGEENDPDHHHGHSHIHTDDDDDACVCRPDFTGPHCEFLVLPGMTASRQGSNTAKIGGILVGVASAVLLVGATLWSMRRRRSTHNDGFTGNGTAAAGQTQHQEGSMPSAPTSQGPYSDTATPAVAATAEML